MKKMLLLLILVLFIAFISCDYNEPEIVDSKDFKAGITVVEDDIVKVSVHFYANVGISQFFYYVDSEYDGLAGVADMCVRCYQNSFTVSQESPLGGSGGYYPTVVYTGTPVITGEEYYMEFPLSCLVPIFNPQFNFDYWLYSMESLDRLPDITEDPDRISISYP